MSVDLNSVNARYLNAFDRSYLPPPGLPISVIIPSHPIKHYEMPVQGVGGSQGGGRTPGRVDRETQRGGGHGKAWVGAETETDGSQSVGSGGAGFGGKKLTKNQKKKAKEKAKEKAKKKVNTDFASVN